VKAGNLAAEGVVMSSMRMNVLLQAGFMAALVAVPAPTMPLAVVE
jgi:hypothetical protein